MGDIVFGSMLLRFVLGGSAVVGSTIIAKKMGGKIGGIFAAFPAVYLAALLTIRLDATGNELLDKSVSLSKGAMIGMAANIFFAITAGFLCARKGWKRGLVYSLICWLLISCLILFAEI